MAIITSYADDAVTTDDDKFLTSNSAGVTTLTPASNVNKYIGPGWTIAADSWAYSSYSSATNLGVITTTAGANTRYSVGMKVKFTQPTLGIKYGFIDSVAGSSITVSFVGGTVLSNEAITLPFYSTAYAPNQYPLGSPVISTGYSDLNSNPNTVTYNGNRSYDLVFNSINHTGVLGNGMRLQLTRTVAAPTRCTLLNGTSQYFNRTSTINGMTATDDISAGVWMKLTSYKACTIFSRYNGTSGWKLSLNADGTVYFIGYNGGSSNFSLVQSYPAVPLGRWVHVLPQLDMSAFTLSATTSYILFDGVEVVSQVARGGTNPTAFIQAGNLEVGSENGGSFNFPGKIAQIFIGPKITQANGRALMSQGITAALITANSIVSAYSFDNSLNDLNTTNANNLTAQGSATATNADSPFGTQENGLISSTLEYAIIQNVSFSTNTTLTVQVPEGCMLPTSGGISKVSYSNVAEPFGMPVKPEKWTLMYLNGNSLTTTSSTLVAMLGAQILAPVGCWEPIARFSYQFNNIDLNVALSTSTTSASDLSMRARDYATSSALHLGSIFLIPSSISVTVATPTYYYLLGAAVTGGTLAIRGNDDVPSYITLLNGYL